MCLVPCLNNSLQFEMITTSVGFLCTNNASNDSRNKKTKYKTNNFHQSIRIIITTYTIQ